MQTKRRWKIWLNSYHDGGFGSGFTPASLEASNVVAETFEEACKLHFGDDPLYDANRGTYWGIRLGPTKELATRGARRVRKPSKLAARLAEVIVERDHLQRKVAKLEAEIHNAKRERSEQDDVGAWENMGR